MATTTSQKQNPPMTFTDFTLKVREKVEANLGVVFLGLLSFIVVVMVIVYGIRLKSGQESRLSSELYSLTSQQENMDKDSVDQAYKDLLARYPKADGRPYIYWEAIKFWLNSDKDNMGNAKYEKAKGYVDQLQKEFAYSDHFVSFFLLSKSGLSRILVDNLEYQETYNREKKFFKEEAERENKKPFPLDGPVLK